MSYVNRAIAALAATGVLIVVITHPTFITNITSLINNSLRGVIGLANPSSLMGSSNPFNSPRQSPQ